MKKYFYRSLLFLSPLTFLISCNQSEKVSFPKDKWGSQPPVVVPLVFGDAKKIKWDTLREGNFKPIVQKLDINALPIIPYDSNDFKPFSQPPKVLSFDFNSLPEKDLDLEALPSLALEFKTSILVPPKVTKSGAPSLQKGKALDIYDFGRLQGFTGSFVGDIYMDNGLLWIGGNGLWQYDGERLKTYIHWPINSNPIGGLTKDQSENIWFTRAGSSTIGMMDTHHGTIGYSSKIVGYRNNKTNLTVDHRGNIWVYNTLDKAVSIISPKANTYKNITLHNGLSDSTAYQILEDKNQNIWITTNSGVNIIDPVKRKIKYLHKANGLSSDLISAITQGKDGKIWLASPSGLDAVDIDKETITHYGEAGSQSPYALALKFDSKDQLWVATLGGIGIVNLENNSFRIVKKKDGLTSDVPLALASDQYNRMWVGTNTGMNMIDQFGKTVHPFGTTPIISTKEDGVGNLWVATSNGLYIVNPERTAMRLLNTSRGLSNNFVQAFYVQEGKMIVCTNGGYNIIDPVKKTLVKAGKKEGLINDTIYVAASDKVGNIWLSGPSNGINVLKLSQNMILHAGKLGGLSDNAILDIKQDKKGWIWLATQNNGIDVIDPEAGTIKNLNNQPGLSNQTLRMLQEDEYGRMWIGTNKGIYVADIQTNTLTILTTKQGLTSNTILSLLEYEGNILAGTSHKITIIKAPAPGDSIRKWRISPLAKSTGIIKETNSWATDATTSDGKYLWGDNGITVIHTIEVDQDSVPTYITSLTVMTQPRDFVNPYKIVGQDTLYDADTLYVKGQKPENTGYVEDKKIAWDSVSGNYNLPVNLKLPYDQNYLQFQFAQANLGRSDTTLYSYTLEGIDKNWSIPSMNSFSENYLNLPPGKYTFKVSSSKPDGTWGQPAFFNFTIVPPWYKTWWAYTLCGLIALGILRAYIVYRSRMLQKENSILEERVNHRTEQLKKTIDELKTTQSQLIQSEKMASLGELTAGIAHEIQNPLNFVNNFSEVNKELIGEMRIEIDAGNFEEVKSLAKDIADNEDKIVFHGKRADGIVKSMLQHSRSSNGRKESTNINALADEYLRLAYHGLRAKDKSFNATMKTSFDESVGSINIIGQDIGRVVLNLITNAFYAVTERKQQQGGDFEPTVTVSTKRIGKKIEIRVNDNGNGIPQSILDKIFQPFFTTKPTGQGTGLGLSMSYDIITNAHGGELKVETQQGIGTTFIIILTE